MKTKAYNIILAIVATVFLLGGYLWAEELVDLEKSTSSPEAVKHKKKKPHPLYLESLEEQLLGKELAEVEVNYPDATVGESHAEPPQDSDGSGGINDEGYPDGIGGQLHREGETSDDSGEVNDAGERASQI
jgi:hypothetical protein